MCWIERCSSIAITAIKIQDKVIFEPVQPIIKPPPGFRQLRRKYKALCWRLTERNASLLPDIGLRSFRGHHIDHVVSIYQGFRLSINPHLIASPDNLRVIPMKDNLDKGNRLTFEGIELLEAWGIDY